MVSDVHRHMTCFEAEIL